MPPRRGEETAAYVPTGELVGAVSAGRHELLQQIGAGGMGVVYMAEQQASVPRNALAGDWDDSATIIRIDHSAVTGHGDS